MNNFLEKGQIKGNIGMIISYEDTYFLLYL